MFEEKEIKSVFRDYTLISIGRLRIDCDYNVSLKIRFLWNYEIVLKVVLFF